MSRFLHYDKNDTYLENMNYAKVQKERRFNEEREEIERDKIELDKIQNQIEMEKQLEKQKKALLKKQQYEEYTNYLKQRQSELPEERNKLNIKLGGEERVIQKQNYNQQLDNLCLNPTRQGNIQSQAPFVNFSQAGRNYQRGYSHGYNILTGEIFTPSNSNVNKTNINKEMAQVQENNIYQKNNENQYEYNNIKKNENISNAQNNINNLNEEDYLSYMEILRQKELEQNKNININNQQFNNNVNVPLEYEEQLMNNNMNNIPKEINNKIPQYEELLNQQNLDQNQKLSYHNPSSSSSIPIPEKSETKNDIYQLNRPASQNIEKRPYHILDSSKNEYMQNKQKNMLSNYDIFKGKEYYQTQYKQKDDSNNPKFGKLEKQREYAKFLEGQINSKRIYEETINNLSKNSEPEIEKYRNNNMMIFGGMNPYQKIKERNNKLNDIPQDPYSNKSYNINSDSYLSSNPITNPVNSYQFNGRRRFSGRFQNNGSNIIGK